MALSLCFSFKAQFQAEDTFAGQVRDNFLENYRPGAAPFGKANKFTDSERRARWADGAFFCEWGSGGEGQARPRHDPFPSQGKPEVECQDVSQPDRRDPLFG